MILHSRAQSRERVGFSRKGKRFFLVPFLEPIRGCVKGLLTEKQSLHVFSLALGKLTIKFEMLCKETESPQFQNFGGETREFFARCVDGRGDMIRRQTARRCAARARGAVGTAAYNPPPLAEKQSFVSCAKDR